ncbi:MAG: DegT/DnrJ/EryC1/StrS family aminotransferase [Nitrospira sp.]|nr:DegT/DnrJ/EryC1/StrS family aminotransferase [Nitrospira sp.]MBX7039429.1 DegT/DnrJ/EryC1/StrS family aminotransferase [Nitrospira sp.]MCW5795693.1 DegT/DnrJ/EryC1/StrS family aminotransferase [Nitrospira sp.]HMU30639.1 DegT/DnrJ/EryC1/StrS family aminotransferase [Nitrospira sp.]HMV59121.1 DegT/DnrJ/EryC1/StrS family aminotransferase [Nitrospira sp.]
MGIPFYRHDLGEPEVEAVRKVLAGPILTTGEVVESFERRFAAYLGVPHALAVTSCTGALHLSLLALGIGLGDEVITTPMTFIASSTAILEAGAKPVFVDVESQTGNLDATKVEAAITPRTKAILPVHLYGQMCDMVTIRKIADQHGLFVIEDAAHCLEGVRDGVKPGELGDTACFSFYATKNLTCGEGGALVTKDRGLAEKLRLLRLHGMTKTAADRHREGYQHWDMTVLGWKYNMDNIHAALLLPQMDRIEQNWSKRDTVARWYEGLLSDCPGVSVPKSHPQVRHARHLFPVFVEGGGRDAIIQGLQEDGIGSVVNYRAIHLLSYFRDTFGFRVGDFPHAEKIGDSVVSLPFYPAMTENQVTQVTATVTRLLKARR